MSYFIVVRPQVYTLNNGDWATSYESDYVKRRDLKSAINYGWNTLDHDDFWVCERDTEDNRLIQIWHSDGKKRPITDEIDKKEFDEVSRELI